MVTVERKNGRHQQQTKDQPQGRLLEMNAPNLKIGCLPF